MDPFKEAILRNKILVCVYGKLPDYAYFYENDISIETINKRKEWFNSFNKEKFINLFDNDTREEMFEIIEYLDNYHNNEY